MEILAAINALVSGVTLVVVLKTAFGAGRLVERLEELGRKVDVIDKAGCRAQCPTIGSGAD